MSVIGTESGSEWVQEVWSIQSGELKLRSALNSKNRFLTAVTLFSLAGSGLLLSWSVTQGHDGNLLASGIIVLIAAFYAWNGLRGLDSLDCRLRVDHECRSCREETERWKANGEENR